MLFEFGFNFRFQYIYKRPHRVEEGFGTRSRILQAPTNLRVNLGWQVGVRFVDWKMTGSIRLKITLDGNGKISR